MYGCQCFLHLQLALCLICQMHMEHTGGHSLILFVNACSSPEHPVYRMRAPSILSGSRLHSGEDMNVSRYDIQDHL